MCSINVVIDDRDLKIRLLADRLGSLQNERAIASNEQRSKRLDAEIRKVIAELFKKIYSQEP
jgi:hypothetical protein